MKPGQSFVEFFLVFQGLHSDADNFSSRLEDALGKLVHETRAGTAIDAANTSFGQFAAEGGGGASM